MRRRVYQVADKYSCMPTPCSPLGVFYLIRTLLYVAEQQLVSVPDCMRGSGTETRGQLAKFSVSATTLSCVLSICQHARQKPLPVDFQRQYATVIIELDDINKVR